MPLRIPERYRGGIASIGSLSEESFSALLSLMKKGMSGDTAEELATQYEAEFPDLTPDKLTKLISAVASLQSVDNRSHTPRIKLAGDVWESLSTDAPQLAKELDADVLKKRVVEVTTARDIHITSSKIIDLQTEVERSFCTVRILTDIRTAFSDNATEPEPKGATILHSMKLGYHDDSGRHHDFYVTLENEDLDSLLLAIGRAQEKKKALEQLLRKADCPFFE